MTKTIIILILLIIISSFYTEYRKITTCSRESNHKDCQPLWNYLYNKYNF